MFNLFKLYRKVVDYFTAKARSAHSSYLYHLYIQDLKTKDVDYVRNQQIRERFIQGNGTFRKLKLRYFNRMKREGKLICIFCQRQLKIYNVFDGKKPLPKDMVTVEHIIPTSEGGLKYVEVNFACACSKCNGIRNTYPIYKVSETEYIYRNKFVPTTKKKPKSLVVS